MLESINTSHYVSTYQIKDMNSVQKLYELVKDLDYSKDINSVNGYLDEHRSFEDIGNTNEHVKSIVKEIDSNMNEYLDKKKVITISNSLLSLSILRMKAFSSLPVHTDEQIDSSMFFRNFVILVYLNEVEGGELLLPNQGMAIKPTRGKMVVFPTGFMYPHGVNVPLENRYALRLNYGIMLK